MSTAATAKDSPSTVDPKSLRSAPGPGSPPPSTSWKMAGRVIAATASSSIEDWAVAAVRSKRWRSRPSPPTSIAAPGLAVEQGGAALRLGDVASGLLQALEVLLGFGAARPGGGGAAGGAGGPAGQAAQRRAQPGGELGEWPRTGRRGDRLWLVEAGQREVEAEVAASQAAGL